LSSEDKRIIISLADLQLIIPTRHAGGACILLEI